MPMEVALKRVQAAVARARGSFVSPAVEARATAGMGVGVVAREPLPKDALVLRASRDAWRPFSAENALEAAQRQAPRFLQQVDELVAGNRALQAADSFVPNALVLGAHLLVNFPRAEDASSALLTAGAGLEELYVSALPRHVDLPFYWDDAQLQELEGCADVARSIQQAARFYLQVYQHLFGAGNALVSPGTFFWAVSVLMSRATSGKGQPFTLIPFFDWFNHSDRGDECVHEYDPHSGTFTVHTTRAYAPGEQLCINYGHHSNVRLLRNYGFALPANAHDVAELPLPRELQTVRTDDPAAAQKLALLESLRLPGVTLRRDPARGSQALPTKRSARLLPDGQLAWESRRWLEVLLAAPEEIQQLVEQAVSGAEGGVAFPAAVGDKVDCQTMAMVDDRLRQHKSSLEDDERFLDANELQLAPWLRSCLYVRTGEKRILHAAKAQHANSTAAGA